MPPQYPLPATSSTELTRADSISCGGCNVYTSPDDRPAVHIYACAVAALRAQVGRTAALSEGTLMQRAFIKPDISISNSFQPMHASYGSQHEQGYGAASGSCAPSRTVQQAEDRAQHIIRQT